MENPAGESVVSPTHGDQEMSVKSHPTVTPFSRPIAALTHFRCRVSSRPALGDDLREFDRETGTPTPADAKNAASGDSTWCIPRKIRVTSMNEPTLHRD